MMVGFSLWALVHLLANGDLASIIFFGTFFVVAAAGMPSIDKKRKKTLGHQWDRFAEQTSILPFGAIIAGRQKLRIGEIGWAKIVGGLMLYALIYYLHGWMFGMQPVLVTS